MTQNPSTHIHGLPDKTTASNTIDTDQHKSHTNTYSAKIYVPLNTFYINFITITSSSRRRHSLLLLSKNYYYYIWPIYLCFFCLRWHIHTIIVILLPKLGNNDHIDLSFLYFCHTHIHMQLYRKTIWNGNFRYNENIIERHFQIYSLLKTYIFCIIVTIILPSCV